MGLCRKRRYIPGWQRCQSCWSPQCRRWGWLWSPVEDSRTLEIRVKQQQSYWFMFQDVLNTCEGRPWSWGHCCTGSWRRTQWLASRWPPHSSAQVNLSIVAKTSLSTFRIQLYPPEGRWCRSRRDCQWRSRTCTQSSPAQEIFSKPTNENLKKVKPTN